MLLHELTTGAVAELLDRAAERGYLLVSDFEDLREPLTPLDEWRDHLATLALQRRLELVDDLGGEEVPPSLEARMSLSTDPVRQYMDAAGRHELLDAMDEADLAKRYQAGLAATKILQTMAKLSPKRRTRLAAVVEDGERAKERMIHSNLRLVVAQAKSWLGRDLDLIELIQEGNLGLIRAVEKFDHTKGYKFSTYAVWWIRQALQRGVANKSRTIRVPAHVWELSARLRRTETDLRQELGRDPTEAEVAERAGMPVERLREVREAMQESRSLDSPVGEDGDASVGDLIADDAAEDPAISASAADARARVDAVLSRLDPRERHVLELRYGFIDGEPRTLDEVGEWFGLSRERIRQIEQEALAKLRHPAAGASLEGLLPAVAA